MNGWDWLILILIAAAVLFAVRKIRRTGKSGGCSCGCSDCPACPACCASRSPNVKKKEK